MKIKEITETAWKIIKFPFWLFHRFIRFISYSLLLIIAIFFGFEFVEYQNKAYKNTDDGACADVNAALETFSKNLPRSYRCINLENKTQRSETGELKNLVFFVSNEPNPVPERTGHGWVIFAQAKKLEGQKYELCEYLPVGFFPPNRETKWPAPIVDFYTNNIRVLIPASMQEGIDKFLIALYLELDLGNESAPVIEAKCGFVMDEIFLSDTKLNNLFGSNPATVLVAVVPSDSYENAKKLIERFKDRQYSLLFNDCTTFLYDVAKIIGLYVPPRIFAPFPTQSVEAFSQLNWSPNA